MSEPQGADVTQESAEAVLPLHAGQARFSGPRQVGALGVPLRSSSTACTRPLVVGRRGGRAFAPFSERVRVGSLAAATGSALLDGGLAELLSAGGKPRDEFGGGGDEHVGFFDELISEG